MDTKTTNYSDVFGNQATVQMLMDGFEKSQHTELAEYLEAEAVALHGSEANNNDYAAMARQIDAELSDKAERLADRLLDEAAADGVADWDTINVLYDADTDTYTEADNGDGDETSEDMNREDAKYVLINDILLRKTYMDIE